MAGPKTSPRYQPKWELYGGYPPWDSHRHLNGIRVQQLGIATNLALVVALAILGFLGKQIVDLPAPQTTAEHVRLIRLEWTLWLAVAGVALGAAISYNRLLDFWRSSRVARRMLSIHWMRKGSKEPHILDRGKTIEQLELENEKAEPWVKWHGRLTYILLALQLGAVVAAVVLYGIAVTG
jgi:hypothetical protein